MSGVHAKANQEDVRAAKVRTGIKKGSVQMEKIQAPNPGIYYDVPFSEYLKWEAFSKSMIGSILKSPMHLKDKENRPLSGASIEFGNQVEDWLLEKETFWNKYVLLPNEYEDSKGNIKPFTLMSSKCRQIKENYERMGLQVVTPDKIFILEEIESKVNLNYTAKNYLSGTPQVSVVWQDEETGVICKGRYDVLNEDSIADLKTTKDASISKFRKDMMQLNYHCQAWMYQESWAKHNNGEILPFIFVVIENCSPYGIITYAIREDSLEVGKHKARQAMQVYKNCVETGIWNGYPEEVIDIDIPEYAIHKALNEGVIE